MKQHCDDTQCDNNKAKRIISKFESEADRDYNGWSNTDLL